MPTEGSGPTADVDQGFRYELCGLVAALDVLELAVVQHPQARLVELAQGLALVPITRSLSHALASGGRAVPPETGFWMVVPGVLELAADASSAGPVAYLEADYLGHDGRQTAAVWEGGALVDGPHILNRSEPFPRSGGGPIGAALRRLGVVAPGRSDEFVVLGLGRCRRTEDWA